MLTLEQFKEARNVLQGVLRPTPLIHSPYLSKSCGNNVYLKPENMQVTGAYKIRGAYYKISTLTDEEKARGLVTASAGNHAQGVAYAAQAAGVAATIVMPTTTPLVKVNNTKDYGANVVLHGEVFDDAAELAAQLAEELNGMNARRQEEEEIILAKVEDAIAAHPEKKLDRVMVVAAEGLNHGVVGIVSAKVLGLYGKPNIILSVDGDTATGSARSVEFFSMFKAIHSCGGLLEKYGGHAMAAGLTLQTEKIPEFDRQINAYAARQHDQMPVVSQKIDKILHASDINVNDVSALEMLEPFGEGNPQPLFLLKSCVIEGIQPMSENRHLKLKVRFEEKSIYVLYFRMSTDRFIYPVGAAVDILANLELNTFRENVSIAVRLKDIRPAGFSDEKFGNALHYYQKIRRGEPVAEKILAISVPSLEELRGLYKLLRNRKGSKNHLDLFYVEAVASRMNYCKYRLILDIFEELGLISIPPDGSSISVEEVGKVDLESSRILTSLRQAGDSAGKGV